MFSSKEAKVVPLLGVYSLFDIKANIYNLPFYQSNDALAVRMVQDLVSDERSSVARHPEDFQLFKLGTFDSSSGDFKIEKQPVYMITASELSAPLERDLPPLTKFGS